MTFTPAHSPPQPPAGAAHREVERGRPCPHCGGSGTLRLADQRYRTCLECLGRGRLLAIGDPSPLASVRTASPASSSAAR